MRDHNQDRKEQCTQNGNTSANSFSEVIKLTAFSHSALKLQNTNNYSVAFRRQML